MLRNTDAKKGVMIKRGLRDKKGKIGEKPPKGEEEK